MSAIDEEAADEAPDRRRRWAIGVGAAVAVAVVIGILFMVFGGHRASRAEEDAVMAAFRREVDNVNAAYAPKINPDRVIWLISAGGLSKGFDLKSVTAEVRAYQADNAMFQDVVRRRPDILREMLQEADVSRSRQKQVIESFETGRNPRFATRAFLMRHELGEEVMIIADLLERRRGTWRMAGDQLVFETSADRQLYERAVQRQQEIQSAIPPTQP